MNRASKTAKMKIRLMRSLSPGESGPTYEHSLMVTGVLLTTLCQALVFMRHGTADRRLAKRVGDAMLSAAEVALELPSEEGGMSLEPSDT